ncbi:MAG: hypothetical protein AAF465_02785 [Pseudomonadota bacterium]
MNELDTLIIYFYGTITMSIFNRRGVICGAMLAICGPGVVQAEVVTSSDTHYVLKHEGKSTLEPQALWRKLIKPATWWHPDHTYSGDATNLSLAAIAGGEWREDWAGGSVLHGKVVLALRHKTLRLEAPFGPLQELGAYVIWTITLTPNDGGSNVVFEERAVAPMGSALDSLAPVVDGVKAEAMSRLVNE